MQLAYFFTIAIYMVLCGIALIFRSVVCITCEIALIILDIHQYLGVIRHEYILHLLYIHLNSPHCFCVVLPIFSAPPLSSYSMASSFRKNYVLLDTSSNSAWQLLCSWDFNITNERAVRQRKNNLRVQLKVNTLPTQHTVTNPFNQERKSGKRSLFCHQKKRNSSYSHYNILITTFLKDGFS